MPFSSFTKRFGKVSEFVTGIIERLKRIITKRLWVKFIYTYTFVATRENKKTIYRNIKTGVGFMRPFSKEEREMIELWKEQGILEVAEVKVERKLEGRVISYTLQPFVKDDDFETKIEDVFEMVVRNTPASIKKTSGDQTYSFIFEERNAMGNEREHITEGEKPSEAHSWRYDFIGIPLTKDEMDKDSMETVGYSAPDGYVVFYVELYDNTYGRLIFQKFYVIREDYMYMSADEIYDNLELI